MGRLKFLNVRAVADDGRMTVSGRKSQDSPDRTIGKDTVGIVVETIGLVDVSGDRINRERRKRVAVGDQSGG